jgi:hypothetical protein
VTATTHLKRPYVLLLLAVPGVNAGRRRMHVTEAARGSGPPVVFTLTDTVLFWLPTGRQ